MKLDDFKKQNYYFFNKKNIFEIPPQNHHLATYKVYL